MEQDRVGEEKSLDMERGGEMRMVYSQMPIELYFCECGVLTPFQTDQRWMHNTLPPIL